MPNSVEKRPYKARREYLLRAVQRRRKKIRELSLEYKGRKCMRCGYDRCLEALEFHHIASGEKDFGISARGHSRSWEKTRQELDKCILLCANCHREIHAQKFSEGNFKLSEVDALVKQSGGKEERKEGTPA